MKFNIIMEDGGIYKDCLVLTNRGAAENKRDIHINLKYEKGITICNKYYLNKWLDAKDIYDSEEIKKVLYVESKDEDESENEEIEDEELDLDLDI